MIYQSTGAFPVSNIVELIEAGDYDFISAYELSSGPYIEDIESYLAALSCSAKLAIHNYFPVPATSFVLNLSSQNPKIVDLSLAHIKRAIDLASKFCTPYYSFHAGFLLDPSPDELGNISPNKKKIPRDLGTRTFVNNVNKIADYAEKKNVTLMIENNVCSRSTLNKFGESPLLFCDVEGASDLIKSLDPRIKFLCDYAHLKVSAHVLDYDAEAFLNEINNGFKACHLSDNNGSEDQNLAFNEESWFWDLLPKDLEYYSIEVYQSNPETLKNCHFILEGHLNEL